METTQTGNISAVEKLFVRSGKVVSVRKWTGGKVHEIHIYLPNATFEKWKSAQSIKCRISAFHYTEYTPAMWDDEEKTCTLYVDTSHAGEGSNWTKNQSSDNDFHYLKIEDVKHAPVPHKRLHFLGDQTAIGHFCALQQLAGAQAQVSGCIALNCLETVDAFYENCTWLSINAVSNYGAVYRQTEQWIFSQKHAKNEFVLYVVGKAELVVMLRKLLKSNGFDGNQIKSKGFWH